MTAAAQPIKVLILALGGEGGGVLADWIVDAAIDEGFPVQATSVPGVAQRTGATSYYIELWPERDPDGQLSPVFCLSPSPGDLDLIVSSELLETARALERGLADASRTMLISSTSRFLTVAEKSAMAEARYDAARVADAARALSREAVLFDMGAAARETKTVLSAVMFGAIAQSGVLPLSHAACERVVRNSGRAAEASLAGYGMGAQAVRAAREPSAASSGAAQPKRRELPSFEEVLRLGCERTADYQDTQYAEQYAQRVQRIRAAELGSVTADVDAPTPVSAEAARWLALWMTYEDVIRVADLKSRPERFARIRQDHGAADAEPVIVHDFLKPGFDEIAAVLPTQWAERVRRLAERTGRATLGNGVTLATSRWHGRLAMRLLARARPRRRASARFAQEQARIDQWIAAIERALALDVDRQARSTLALSIARLPRLLKGYGQTYARGLAGYERIFATLIDGRLGDATDAAAASAAAIAIGKAIDAALAEPEGRALAAALGIAPPPPREAPLRFVPMRRRNADTL